MLRENKKKGKKKRRECRGYERTGCDYITGVERVLCTWADCGLKWGGQIIYFVGACVEAD